MPFGYIGQNQPKQKVKNSGVLSSFEASHLDNQGHLGGAYELIEKQTISNGAQALFENIKASEYSVHILQIENYTGASGGNVALRYYESGTEETANVYKGAMEERKSDSGEYNPANNGTNYVFLCPASLATDEVANVTAYIYGAGNSSSYTTTTAQTVQIDPVAIPAMSFGGHVMTQASTVDKFKVYNSATVNFSATVTLYGLKE